MDIDPSQYTFNVSQARRQEWSCGYQRIEYIHKMLTTFTCLAKCWRYASIWSLTVHVTPMPATRLLPDQYLERHVHAKATTFAKPALAEYVAVIRLPPAQRMSIACLVNDLLRLSAIPVADRCLIRTRQA